MGNAMLSGVSGLKASQQKLDVAGNNLANMSTTAYKSGRVTFKDLLYQTLQGASAPTASSGGTNPMQAGSGVSTSTIDRNMNQGTLENTGQPLDMAIEGSGLFVVNNGTSDRFTRVGTFAVDADYNLVDSEGNRVQRTGTYGLTEGFQNPGDSNILIPYNVPLPAQATTYVNFVGNLSADDTSATTQTISSGLEYTTTSGTSQVPAASTTDINSLNQVTTPFINGDTIDIPYILRDGTTGTGAFTFGAANDGVTLGDLLGRIETLLGGSTAVTTSTSSGQLRVQDTASGYSQMEVGTLAMGGGATGVMEFPQFFEINSAGGVTARDTAIEIFDSQGMSHILSTSFVKSGVDTWDAVVMDVTGGVSLNNRRIQGITFDSSGALLNVPASNFQLEYAYAPGAPIDVSVGLGSVGSYDGLTQFGGASMASSDEQDGYAAGYLTDITVARDGVLVGSFSNGLRRDVAALRLATFQNPNGLEAIGNNYFQATGNSGAPNITQALSGGAGSIRGASLEGSNVEVSTEFVNLIQAQNSFQANSRTIRIANDMLKELSQLIR